MKQKENRVMIYFGAIVLSVGILLVIWAAFVLAEEVTITTYYPAPYGVYDGLQTNKFAVGDTNGSGQLDRGDLPDNDGDLWVVGHVGIGGDPGTGNDRLKVYGDLYNDEDLWVAGHVGIGGGPGTGDNRLDVYGKIRTTAIDGGKTVFGGLDIAEDILAEGCEPGDVVVIDPNNNHKVTKCRRSFDTTVAGIISEDPAFHIGKQDKEGYLPLALAGRVPCKVTAENGSIKRGNLLVTSSKPGYAMRADLDKLKPGMILGKALEPLEEGEGKIVVLVTLQ